MLRMTPVFTIVSAALVLVVGCNKGPCGGKKSGMVVDERPLEGELAEIIGPTGGTMCKDSSSGDEYKDTNRHYELPGKTPGEAVDAWNAHMQAKGWVECTPAEVAIANLEKAVESKDNCGLLESWWKKDGSPARVQVSTSFCVDKGWTTITLHRCDGNYPSPECEY